MQTSIRLFELNEFIRRTIALNFPSLLWVSCEIAQLNESRGHFYLTLIEKEEDGEAIKAQSEAMIWQRDYRRIKRKIGVRLDKILQEGMEVLVQVKVEYHERFGLSLAIQDLEGDYTLGKIALRRQENIEKLHRAGLLAKNAQLPLPLAFSRLAVISSSTAAGYQDYLQHLQENIYGYQFANRLFPAAMQGNQSSREIIKCLEAIARQADRFDTVLIIRGGGAKMDLLAFDDLELAETVANHPLPVLVGIGHEIDETVLDLVAHQSLKTPTAVADFLLQQNYLFESSLIEVAQQLQSAGQRSIQDQQLQLRQTEQIIDLQTKNLVRQEKQALDRWQNQLLALAQRCLFNEKQSLENLEQKIHLLSPEECLRRGYSITLFNGKAIGDNTTLADGSILETHLKNRLLKSKIIDHEQK